jgi:hypothetical protein
VFLVPGAHSATSGPRWCFGVGRKVPGHENGSWRPFGSKAPRSPPPLTVGPRTICPCAVAAERVGGALVGGIAGAAVGAIHRPCRRPNGLLLRVAAGGEVNDAAGALRVVGLDAPLAMIVAPSDSGGAGPCARRHRSWRSGWKGPSSPSIRSGASFSAASPVLAMRRRSGSGKRAS